MLQRPKISEEHQQHSNAVANTSASVETSITPPPFQLNATAPIQQKEDEEKEVTQEKVTQYSFANDGTETPPEDNSSNGNTPPSNNNDSNSPYQLKKGKTSGLNSANGLPHYVQTKMENTLGHDFSNVNIHTNSQQAKDIGALAYTQGNDVHFAPGQFKPDTKQGQELIGHEFTHVVQQSQGRVKPTTQAKGISVNDDKGLEKEADDIGRKAAAFQLKKDTNIHPSNNSKTTNNTIQRKSIPNFSLNNQPTQFYIGEGLVDGAIDLVSDGIEWVEEQFFEEIGDWASNQRGYDLFCTIIQQDIITGAPIKRTGAKLIQGFLELLPAADIYRARLEESGKLEELGAWLDIEMQVLQSNLNLSAITTQITAAIKDLGVTNIGETIDKVIDAVLQPVEAVVDFAVNVGTQMLLMIKDSLLIKLQEHIEEENTVYPLITVILGKDPITDTPVPRTAENFIRGFLSLVPGGEERFKNLQESGAIQDGMVWLEEQIALLNLTWSGVKALFQQAWDSISIQDLADPIGAFVRIVGIFAEPVERIITFAFNVGKKVFEFIFKGVMRMVGGEQVLGMLDKAEGTFIQIVEDPVAFLGNLIDSVKQGFGQFAGNILEHLQTGIIEWLTGTLTEAGITLPETWDFKGFLSFGLQLMGITYDNMRAKLVDRIGEEAVGRLESTFEVVRSLVTEGPGALWQQFLDYVGNLKDMAFDALKSWLMTTVVGAAVTKLVTMFNPVGAIIQSIISIYNTIMFFIERAQQIMAVLNSIVDSIANIAAGNISGAANYVEQTLARGIPVALGFLARFIGIGDPSGKIREVIDGFRAIVDSGIDRILDWIIEQGSALIGGIRDAAGSVRDTVMGWLGLRKVFTAEDGHGHTLYFENINGSGVLMLASTPMTYQLFISGITREKDFSDNPHLQDVKKRAIQTSNEIDSLIQSANSNKNSETEEDPTLNAQIISKMTILAPLTVELMKDADQVHESTPPVYGGVNEGGFGTIGTIEYLSSKTTGTKTNNSLTTEKYSILDQRKNGGSTYYVRGHLISSQLHGSGTDWSNLTPLSRSGNAQHEINAESKIKDTIGGDPPRAFFYVVRPIYGRPIPSWVNSTQDSNDPDIETKKKIATAERFVPNGLNVTIQELNPSTRAHISSPLNVDKTILNHVDQSGPEAYQVVDKIPEPDYPININNATEQELMFLPNIGPKLAGTIIDNTPYSSIQEIMNISGIGQVIFDQIQSKITI